MALAEFAAFFGAPFADFENVKGVATADGGSVLRTLDATMASYGYVRVPHLHDVPCGLQLIRPNASGGPGLRERASGHYELAGISHLIGPCPPLAMAEVTPKVIADILDSGPRDSTLVVHGCFKPADVPLRKCRFPVTAGWITLGGPGAPLFVGSRVTCVRLGGITWVVVAIHDRAVSLFLDDRKSPRWRFLRRRRDDPLRHLEFTHRVLHTCGTAMASTEFGVPPIGCAKQLWLVGSDVVSPSASELWRVQEHDVSAMGEVASTTPHHLLDALPLRLRQLPGKGINSRLSAAMARRSLARCALLRAAISGRVAAFASSFEHALATCLRPLTWAPGFTVVLIVVLTWIGHRPYALVDLDSARLPAVETAASSPRKAATATVSALLSSSDKSLNWQSILVSDSGYQRVVVVPAAHHAPAQLQFGALTWTPLDQLAGTPLHASVACAAGVAASHLAMHARLSLPPPALPGGARPASFVPQPLPELSVSAKRWKRQQRDDRDAASELRAAFLNAGADPDDAAWFDSWADQAKGFSPDEVPPNLRGARQSFERAELQSTPFAYRDAVPTTVPAPTPPPQVTSYRPTSLCPGIFKPAVLERWKRWWPRVVADLQRFKVDRDAVRSFNEPFVVTQRDLRRQARDIVWDLRRISKGGHYLPVDYTARLQTRTAGSPLHDPPGVLRTHLGVSFLADEWADFADQEMVAMITSTGVDFRIDGSADQLVVFPHLVSLPKGFVSVESELRRLNTLTFNEFCASFPFVPWQALPQGATARKYEDRWRRTTEGGAPRTLRRDSDGRSLVPLNTLIGAKDEVASDAVSWQLPGLPTTTGFLTYESAEAAPRKSHKSTRWPPEIKSGPRDLMHDTCVLKHAQRHFGGRLFIFTADAKDFFNQLRLAAWMWRHVGLFWLPLDETHADYSCVAEYCLGFGLSCASNIAQRFANGLLYIFWRAFDALDDASFDESDPWVVARRALSRVTGRNECRLAAAHMYTDDPVFLVLGAMRAVRLLRVWRWVTQCANLTMAIAAKHSAGTRANWLGLVHLSELGATVIPAAKHIQTISALRALVSDSAFAARDFEALLGLLEHLLPWAGGRRSAMMGFYAALKRAMALGPSTPVHLNEVARRSALAWIDRLRGRAGVSSMVVFDRDAFERDAPTGVEYIISTDAAKDGTARPGLGGFCHGLQFCLPLAKADVKGPAEIPIAVLEFIAIVVAVLIFAPLIADAADVISIGSDSLTSVDAVLNDSSHAELMQLVHAVLLASPEYAMIRHKLRLGHIFGEGNVWADAVSRGYDDVIRALSRQLGVAPVDSTVPPRAFLLLDEVRDAIELSRGLTPRERGTWSGVKASTEGDGPPEFAHLAVASTVPRMSSRGGGGPRSLSPTAPQCAPAAPTAAPSTATAASAASAASGPFDHLRRGRTVPRMTSGRRCQASPLVSVPAAPSSSVARPVRARDETASDIARSAVRGEAKRQRSSALLDALRRDTSQFALRPASWDRLTKLIDQIGNFIDSASPDGTLSKDATAWRRFDAHCRDLGTTPWRPSHEGLSHDEVLREKFILASYTVNEYTVNIKPRGGPAPKPASAMNNAAAVKRVLRRAGTSVVATPELTVILKGMLRQYVEMHGPEALVPKRAEPLTNEDMDLLLQIPQGTVICGRSLNWEHPFWCSFRAFLLTARMAAFRKADVLPINLDDFDLASASRANLSWFFRGVHRNSLTELELRSLAPGDRAIIKPPPCKNDPFGETFGNLPIYLPYVPGDPLNAATWLRNMELVFPVLDEKRREFPLFPLDTADVPLTHGPADRAFRGLCDAGLHKTRADALTLHSPRVFAACALLAKGASRPLIMALCRWKSEASLQIYARLQPEDYAQWMMKMANAKVTSATARYIPELDNFALAQAVEALPGGG